MSYLEEIHAERRRQVEAEGWTPAHDDEHVDGALLRAAVIYLWHGTDRAAPLNERYKNGSGEAVPMGWPWEPLWWKPKERRRNLIRSGALCLAEKDRRIRRKLPTDPADQKFALVLSELDRLDHAAG